MFKADDPSAVVSLPQSALVRRIALTAALGFFSFFSIVMPKCGSAIAAEKVALLIGNANYLEERSLANPHRDVDAFHKLLVEKLKFSQANVKVIKDADHQRVVDELREFQRRAVGADLAVVFYSGHGFAFNDANYMAPVDVPRQLVMRNDKSDRVIHIEEVQRSVAPSKIGLIFWDACRNSGVQATMAPGARATSASRDLIPVDTRPSETNTVGTFIAFATNPRETADDGPAGDLSPFTKALTRRLAGESRPFLQMMAAVSDDVVAATRANGRSQVPEVRLPRMSPAALNFSLAPLAAPTSPGAKGSAGATSAGALKPAAGSQRAPSPPSIGGGVVGGGLF